MEPFGLTNGHTFPCRKTGGFSHPALKRITGCKNGTHALAWRSVVARRSHSAFGLVEGAGNTDRDKASRMPATRHLVNGVAGQAGLSRLENCIISVTSSQQKPNAIRVIDWMQCPLCKIACRAEKLNIAGSIRTTESKRHDVVHVPLCFG